MPADGKCDLTRRLKGKSLYTLICILRQTFMNRTGLYPGYFTAQMEISTASIAVLLSQINVQYVNP